MAMIANPMVLTTWPRTTCGLQALADGGTVGGVEHVNKKTQNQKPSANKKKTKKKKTKKKKP